MATTIEYSEKPSLAMKRMIRAAQAGVNAAADVWAHEIMPRHFEPEAEQTYGYTPRKGEGEPAWVYSTDAKGLLTKKGRRIRRNKKYVWSDPYYQRPLVRTGDTQDMAVAGVSVRKETVDAGTVRAVVRVPVPDYFFKWRERTEGGHVDKVKELTTITPAEESALEQVVRTTVDELMSRYDTGARQIVQAA